MAKGAPPAPDAKMRTVKVTAELAAKGKASWVMCAACHGQEAEGRVGMAPRLASKSFLAAASDRFLKQTIENGRAGTTMTPWKAALKPDQIDGIVAFLRTAEPVPPVKLNEAPLKGDAAKGAVVYRAICATCHGRSGAGYQESGSGTGIGRAAFLESATNGYLRYLVRHGKSLTPMKAFRKNSPTAVANLSDQEIEDVLAHLRKAAW